MSRATQDVEAVRAFVAMGSVRAIYVLTTVLAISGIMFFTDWRLALITLAVLPPVSFHCH